MPLDGNSDPGVQGHCAESFRFVSCENDRMLYAATESLRACYARIAGNAGHTDVQYWQAQGDKGKKQAQAFGAWKAALLAIYQLSGQEPPADLTAMGSTLVLHDDGTVTVGT